MASWFPGVWTHFLNNTTAVWVHRFSFLQEVQNNDVTFTRLHHSDSISRKFHVEMNRLSVRLQQVSVPSDRKCWMWSPRGSAAAAAVLTGGNSFEKWWRASWWQFFYLSTQFHGSRLLQSDCGNGDATAEQHVESRWAERWNVWANVRRRFFIQLAMSRVRRVNNTIRGQFLVQLNLIQRDQSEAQMLLLSPKWEANLMSSFQHQITEDRLSHLFH